MNTVQALAFLSENQPMPPDNDIRDTDCDTFCEVLNHFQHHPDPRCIPLLINSVSKLTGLSMYEDIKFVLLAHSREDAIPYVLQGLTNGNDGVKYRCCWWAADIDAWSLEPDIRPLTLHEEEDIREAAAAFLKLKSEIASP